MQGPVVILGKSRIAKVRDRQLVLHHRFGNGRLLVGDSFHQSIVITNAFSDQPIFECATQKAPLPPYLL